jgi:hypothetical protein
MVSRGKAGLATRVPERKIAVNWFFGLFRWLISQISGADDVVHPCVQFRMEIIYIYRHSIAKPTYICGLRARSHAVSIYCLTEISAIGSSRSKVNC